VEVWAKISSAGDPTDPLETRVSFQESEAAGLKVNLPETRDTAASEKIGLERFRSPGPKRRALRV